MVKKIVFYFILCVILNIQMFGQDKILNINKIDIQGSKIVEYEYENHKIYITKEENKRFRYLFTRGFLSGEIIEENCPCINTPEVIVEDEPNLYNKKVIDFGYVKIVEFDKGKMILHLNIECFDETDNELQVELKLINNAEKKGIKSFLKSAKLEYIKYLGRDI